MRSKDIKLMNSILNFINDYFCNNHISPSLNEIAKNLSIGKTTVYRYLLSMDEQGLVSYDGERITTEITKKCKSNYFSAPIIGTICCGNPELEEEYIEEYISLPESLFGKGNFYVLRACGDSMTDVGIDSGDLVVIRKQESASIGDIVVALDDKMENTLKMYAGIDKKSKCAILKYQNQTKYKDKKIFVEKLVIQGVAKHIIKSL